MPARSDLRLAMLPLTHSLCTTKTCLITRVACRLDRRRFGVLGGGPPSHQLISGPPMAGQQQHTYTNIRVFDGDRAAKTGVM